MNYLNCVYMYVNKINGKRYIGQAKNFNKRHYKHIYSSTDKKRKKDYNLSIHRAIRKYGIENFEIVILKENLSTQCLMNLYECYYIKKYNTLAKNGYGYNISDGGESGNTFAGKTEEEMIEIKRKITRLGTKHSDETKQKMSKTQKERFKNKENHPTYGTHHSEEHKRKIGESNKGKHNYIMSEETKRKLSKSHDKNKKKIIAISLTDKKIIIAPSMHYLEKIGFHRSNVRQCCLGVYKQYKGYKFYYLDDYREMINDE